MAQKIYIYGKHAIEEVLTHAPAIVRKIYLAPGADTRLRDLISKSGVTTEKLDPRRATSMVERNAPHQGVVALISLGQLVMPVDKFMDTLKPAPGTLLVLLSEVQDPHNVGAVILSSAALGASAVLIPTQKQSPITPAVIKASAGMADCDAYLWVRGDLDISYEAMLSNSSRAVELAPDLAEAHSSRGLALFMAGHAQDADAEFERAIKLDNELYAAHLFYGYSCRDQGKFEKAAELLERAAQLSPSDIWALGVLPDVYNALGRPEQNRAAARRLIIRVEAALSRRPDSADELAMGAASLVDLGENQRAEEWANRALSLDPDSYSVRYNAAGAFAVIGRSGMALDCLEYIFAHMPRTRQWVRRMVSKDTQFHSLRSDPRYKMLMESAGAERKNAD